MGHNVRGRYEHGGEAQSRYLSISFRHFSKTTTLSTAMGHINCTSYK